MSGSESTIAPNAWIPAVQRLSITLLEGALEIDDLVKVKPKYHARKTMPPSEKNGTPRYHRGIAES
jgi:hypothetical protein